MDTSTPTPELLRQPLSVASRSITFKRLCSTAPGEHPVTSEELTDQLTDIDAMTVSAWLMHSEDGEVGLLAIKQHVGPDYSDRNFFPFVLFKLYLLPAWQRQGVGTMLLELVERIALGLGHQKVVLDPQPLGPNQMPDDRLRQWYLDRGYGPREDGGLTTELEKRLSWG